MAEDRKHQVDKEAESANQKINEKFYGKLEGNNDNDASSPTETEQANIELNEQLDSDGQEGGYSPPSYANLNTAAIDVTKKD